MAAVPYSPEFYQGQKSGSLRSAHVIVPLIMQMLDPRSVVDIGCGVGTWLSVFREHKVDDIYGVDGFHIDANALLIPPDKFLASDLSESFCLDRTFDLVISMEVGEHLPASAADAFVDSLVRLGPAVLFSAAIPFQGGTAHVNEQWQDYWAHRFARYGFLPVDCIRAAVWKHPDVQAFYAQNALLYVRRDFLENHALLKSKQEQYPPSSLSLVHPETFLSFADPGRWSVRHALRFFGAVVAARMKARLNPGTQQPIQ